MRQRMRYFDTVASELCTNLEQMPRQLGWFAAYATTRLSTAYVVNYRHDNVAMPSRRVGTEDMPVVVFRRGETLRLGGGFDHMTPRQTIQAQKQLRSWLLSENKRVPDPDGIHTHFQAVLKRAGWCTGASISMHQQTSAQCIYPTVCDVLPAESFRPQNGSHTYTMFGRPILCLAMAGERTERRLYAPADVFHELVHVGQFTLEPLQPGPDAGLRSGQDGYELEAYHWAGQYEVWLQGQGAAPYGPQGIKPYHAKVSSVAYPEGRHPDDLFVMTPEIQRRLGEAKLALR